jgi:chromosome segregation ATPase
MFASDRSKPVASQWLLALLGLAIGVGAHAQSAQDREQEQVKRLKLQMRQLQQDQAAQQEAQAKLEQERQKSEQALKGLQTEVTGHKQAASASSHRVAVLAAEVAALKKERDALQTQVQQVTQQMNEANQAAQRKLDEQQKASQMQALSSGKSYEARIEQCRTQNAQMYQVGADILAQYEHKGVREALGASDPFLQLSRVKLENFKAELQDKLDAARLKAGPTSWPASP